MYRRKMNDDTLESYVYVFLVTRHNASRHDYACGNVLQVQTHVNSRWQFVLESAR